MPRPAGSGRKPRDGVAATVVIPLRLTPTELARIDAVCGPNRAGWMRDWVLAGVMRCEDLEIRNPHLTPARE